MKDQKLITIRNLHRRLGLLLAFFLFLLVVSGMLLNHSRHLDLVNRPLYGGVASFFYGSQALADVPGWPAGDHWFYVAGEQLYMDERQVGSCRSSIRGVAMVPGLLFVLCDSQLLLLDQSGRLVESTRMTMEGLARLGETKGKAILEIDGRAGVLDAEMLTTTPWSGQSEQINWSQADVLPERWSANIAPSTAELNLERLILDLHSGRVLGEWHTVFLDLLGILLLLLAVGGSWTWYARKS